MVAEKSGWLFLCDALIRHYLHIDPSSLCDKEWAMQVRMAEWVKQDFINSIGKLWQTR